MDLEKLTYARAEDAEWKMDDAHYKWVWERWERWHFIYMMGRPASIG